MKAADQERIFAGQLEATQVGVALANESGKNGKPSVVLFQEAKSRINTIWTPPFSFAPHR